MGDKPILFSGPMIRALLDGRKTMTRRVLKPAFQYMLKDQHDRWDSFSEEHWQRLYAGTFEDGTRCIQSLPYAPGDRLWCREAFSYSWAVKDDPEARHLMPCWYWADGDHPTYGDWAKPKPSIHMPRWASRLTLTVTAVKVERLQDITGMDAMREGVSIPAHIPQDGADLDCARREFKSLWTSIHGPGAWEANPWVAAITFTVERRNIDTPTPEQREG